MEIMERVLGRPEDQPARYEARNAIPAAGNALNTNWWFFWDREETMCPPSCVDQWIDSYKAAGGTRVHRQVTGPGDAKRWIHGYRTDNPDLAAADALFMPDVLRPPAPARGSLALPIEGELVVPGYLVTRHFSVFVTDGTEGMVTVRYRLGSGAPDVKVVANPRGLPVTVRCESVTARLPR
jgi:hypothetical protein